MKRLIYVYLVCSLVFAGCSWFKVANESTADELTADGMEYYQDGKYKQAIESFQQLKDWYPFSKYAILAELKIGDAHFNLDQYEEAIFAYEEFESLHPRNEAIPYVTYQIGRCYFEQVDTIDRDQTSARKALDTFSHLIKSYPNSEYARRAQAHVSKSQKILAGHELYVGMYYYKKDHYKAALNRFKAVLSNYPDVGVHQKALQYIAVTEETMRNEEQKEMESGETTESKSFWKFW